MTSITDLYKKFNESGFSGPPITDSELKSLSAINADIAALMQYRGDRTMMTSFLLIGNDINRMIEARKE